MKSIQYNSSKYKVYIDPSCDILYSSFYIQGLYEIFGKKNVKFSSHNFKQFQHNNHFLAFILECNLIQYKMIIDFTDVNRINEKALQWSHIYGKVNLDSSAISSNKVIPIGPSFGVKLFSLVDTFRYALSNLYNSKSRIKNKRRFLSDYKNQFIRPKLSDYEYKNSQTDYIFFMSSLWIKELRTNRFRANFIVTCKQNKNIRFEGGFAPRSFNDMEDYSDITTKKRIPMKEYIQKMKSSMIAFNTPAVRDCHGWKLAEYLILGKAIISTDLSRLLPTPLIDKYHLVFSDGSISDLDKKIKEIICDKDYRNKLEKNAKEYFENQLAPSKVIIRMMETLNIYPPEM